MMTSRRDSNIATGATLTSMGEDYVARRPEVLCWFTASGSGKWALLLFQNRASSFMGCCFGAIALTHLPLLVPLMALRGMLSRRRPRLYQANCRQRMRTKSYRVAAIQYRTVSQRYFKHERLTRRGKIARPTSGCRSFPTGLSTTARCSTSSFSISQNTHRSCGVPSSSSSRQVLLNQNSSRNTGCGWFAC